MSDTAPTSYCRVLETRLKVLLCKSCGNRIDKSLCISGCEWDGSLPSLRSPSSMSWITFNRTDRFLKEEPYVRTIG